MLDERLNSYQDFVILMFMLMNNKKVQSFLKYRVGNTKR